jgi:hypothetical protein
VLNHHCVVLVLRAGCLPCANASAIKLYLS